MTQMNYPEPLVRLLTLGEPTTRWPDYPALYGLTAEHIPDLIRMAGNEQTWEEDSESPSVYCNVHAWRALAQLNAVEAIPALLEILRWVDDYGDDWVGEDLPEALGLIGPAAIPALADYIADAQHGLWARTAAATSLEEIAKRYPESSADCAAAITRTLTGYEQNDPEINAELITVLADLRRPETYSLVEQAYQAKKVDLSVMGDWEDFQIDVGLLDERITKPEYGWGFNSSLAARPSQPKKQTGSKEDKKAKKKRKQEKQSRKKNRKKK